MLKRIVVFLNVILVLLVAAELGTRVWLERAADPATFQRFASLEQLRERAADDARAGEDAPSEMFTRHRYLGYVATPSWVNRENRHNTLGFRGAEITREKPPDELRIACLGGSTTYTTAVRDHTKSYPAVLERELHELGYPEVRVLNAGLHAWTSFESLINLELRVLELEPDIVVVYHGLNDVKTRFVWPPERYRSDNTGYRVSTPSVFLPRWWEQSTLARILMTEHGGMTPHADLQRTLDERTPYAYWSKFRTQLLRGNYPSLFFASVGADRILDANPPTWFERNLAMMTRLTRDHGASMVLVSFALRIEGIGGSNPGTEHLLRAIDEMNRASAAVAERTGARFFDLASVMPLDESLFADHVHVTEEGAALKARLIAEFLSEQVLSPSGAIEPADPFHDFGHAIEDEVLTWSYPLRNGGYGDLHIRQVRPTCDCVEARILIDEDGETRPYALGDPIPPGASFELQTRVNTRDQKGGLDARIDLFSDDPSGLVGAGFTVTLESFLRVEPERADLGPVEDGARSATLAVSSCNGEAFGLAVEERPLPSGLSLELVPDGPRSDRASRWTVEVHADPNELPEGRLRIPVNLVSDRPIAGLVPEPDGLPSTHTATFTIRAAADRAVTYEPRFVSFGLVRPGDSVTRSVVVRAVDPEVRLSLPSVTLAGVEAGASGLGDAIRTSVELEPDERSLEVLLTLDAPATGLPAGGFEESLVIEGAHPSRPRIEVGLGGYARP